MSKIGSPRKNLVYDDNGNLIDGLSIDKSTGSYITQFKNEEGEFKKKTFGKDKAEAISLFRSWQEERQGGKLLTVTKPSYMPSLGKKATFKFSDEAEELLKQHNIDEKWFLGFFLAELRINEAVIPEDFIYNKAAELIRNNPITAAQKMKMPFLADKDFMQKYKPLKTLLVSELWDNFAKKRGFISDKEVNDTKASWDKFVSITGVKTTADLTIEVFSHYDNKIKNEYKTNDLSTTWVKSHFARVRQVINDALILIEVDNMVKFKIIMKKTLKPLKKQIICKPKRIPRELFHKILQVSNVEDKAIWLLSANGAYYPVDIVGLQKSFIDYDRGIIIYQRNKTFESRAAILWAETISALKDLEKSYPNRLPYVFINRKIKTPYVAGTVTSKFNDIMIKLELRKECINKKVNPLNYTHRNFRDTFQSACVAAKIAKIEYNSVMGHKRGQEGDYIDPSLNPDITIVRIIKLPARIA